jgi:hypothetical protein
MLAGAASSGRLATLSICFAILRARQLSPGIVRRWLQKQATPSASRLASRTARSERSITLQTATKPSPKERLEVFAGGQILRLDNFRSLTGYGWKRFRAMNLWRQDKGQKACVAAFLDAIRGGGPDPIPYDEIIEVSRVAIELGGYRGQEPLALAKEQQHAA